MDREVTPHSGTCGDGQSRAQGPRTGRPPGVLVRGPHRAADGRDRLWRGRGRVQAGVEYGFALGADVPSPAVAGRVHRVLGVLHPAPPAAVGAVASVDGFHPGRCDRVADAGRVGGARCWHRGVRGRAAQKRGAGPPARVWRCRHCRRLEGEHPPLRFRTIGVVGVDITAGDGRQNRAGCAGLLERSGPHEPREVGRQCQAHAPVHGVRGDVPAATAAARDHIELADGGVRGVARVGRQHMRRPKVAEQRFHRRSRAGRPSCRHLRGGGTRKSGEGGRGEDIAHPASAHV